MADFLTNAKNRVPQLQRQYQAQTIPVHLRGARGKLYYTTFLGLWAVGVTGTLYGLSSVIIGKKTE
ncbi:hypothetical protein DL93DRAFT_2227831 [Clavulina sp. PMI_390]|nr:hypothetical protein DL93DRAFT_2227831 [Clavulina sp. PMI_390]